MALRLEESTKKKVRTKRSEIEKVKKRIEKVSKKPWIKGAIYGRNKIGKTVFACSSNLPTLIIDCNERGWDSVIDRPNVRKIDIDKFTDIDPLYWYLRSGEHPFEVVVIDTVTMLANLCMKWVLKEEHDRDIDRDSLTPDQRSWGKVGQAMEDAIIKFRNLEMHVIFLAQEKNTSNTDEDGNISVEVHPELSPKPRSTLLSAVGLIGRIFTREATITTKKGREKTIMRRVMLLGSHPKYVAGNRYKGLRYVEMDPTLDGFIEKITGVKKDA